MLYRVIEGTINAGQGRVYVVGDSIELSEEQAAPILALGQLEGPISPPPSPGEPLSPGEAAPLSAADIFNSGGWRALKEVADDLGYSKPSDKSWEEAVSDIQALLDANP